MFPIRYKLSQYSENYQSTSYKLLQRRLKEIDKNLIYLVVYIKRTSVSSIMNIRRYSQLLFL